MTTAITSTRISKALRHAVSLPIVRPSARTAALGFCGLVAVGLVCSILMGGWIVGSWLAGSIAVLGVGWGVAQQRTAPGFYELRVYTAVPGRRDALADRFAAKTAALYARHGITNVGYWIPKESDPELGISAENTFIYIRGYPSKEERDIRLKAAHDDPEFGEIVLKQERNPDTKLIVKAHNVDMVPSGPYSSITIDK